MVVKAMIIRGKYLDSVKLMLISQKLSKLSGVLEAVSILATTENRSILKATGMLVDEILSAGETDIAIVVKAETEESALAAIQEADTLIHAKPKASGEASFHQAPKSIHAAFEKMQDADLCLISVAGKYAVREAEAALECGMHVMLFSDNVSLEDELMLKQKASEKGLLMMGPDCGTAIINGTPLAFANAVSRGKIGIVSAAGTGLQEVSTGISRYGCGISQAFGSGGRDGKAEIGGIMLKSCLQYLIDDEATEVIVMIGKTPSAKVLEELWQMIGLCPKPVVANFLSNIPHPELPNLVIADTLENTAKLACQHFFLAQGKIWKVDADPIPEVHISPDGNRNYIKALYSGGTLCFEAQEIYHRQFGKYPHSNISSDPQFRPEDIWKCEGDAFIDLGSDEYTVGRPHPMIDYSLRLKRMSEEAGDNRTAVILLDVVLGFGAHPDPASELVPAIGMIPKGITVVCHVLGTDSDPQNTDRQVDALREAGAIVFRSNYQAVSYALKALEAYRRVSG